MAQQSNSGQVSDEHVDHWDVRKRGIHHKFSVDNLLADSGGLDGANTLENKSETKFWISKATQSAISQIKTYHKKQDENLVLMNLSFIGYQHVLPEIAELLENHDEVNHKAYKYDIDTENIYGQIQDVEDGSKANTIKFTPYVNVKRFTQRIEEKISGASNMYMRMCLLRGIMEAECVDIETLEGVQRQFDNIYNELFNYSTSKQKEYQRKKVFKELNIDEKKLFDIENLESVEQLKQAVQ